MTRKKNNFYTPNKVLSRAIEDLSKIGQRKVRELPGELRKVAEKGVPDEIQFNQWRLRYCIKDREGVFKLHWFVVNAISGNNTIIYNKDYIGKTGKMRWRDLASAVKKV